MISSKTKRFYLLNWVRRARRLGLMSHRGFSLIAVMIFLMAVLSSVAAISIMVAHSAVSSSQYHDTQRAEEISQSAIRELALTLETDEDWSDRGGVVTGSVMGGDYRLTISSVNVNSVLVESTGTFRQGVYVQTRAIRRGSDMASCVTVATVNMVVLNGGFLLDRLLVSNVSVTPVEISAMSVSWRDSNGSEFISGVSLNAVSMWGGGVGVPTIEQTSGSLETFGTPFILGVGDLDVPLKMAFDQSMQNKTIQFVMYFSDGSSLSTDVVIDVLQMASMVTLDTASAVVSGVDHATVSTVRLTNTDLSTTVFLSSIDVAWLLDEPELFVTEIWVDGHRVWGVGAMPNTSNFGVDVSILPGATISMSFVFSSDARNRQYTLTTHFSDLSTLSGAMDFRFTQAQYLHLDTSSLYRTGSAVSGMALTNHHPDGSPIWLESLGVKLTPNSAQTVSDVVLAGGSILDSMSLTRLGDLMTLTLTEVPDAPQPFELLFSSLRERAPTLSMSFVLSDGSVSASTFVLPSEILNPNLTMTADGARIHSNTKSLFGVFFTNTSESDMLIDTIQFSWVGSTAGLRQAQLGGVNLFQSSSRKPSGAVSDVSGVVVASGASSELNLLFDTSVVSTDFTLLFTFMDGSTRSFTVYLNPATSPPYLGGENFEAGPTFSGGAGFESDWTSNKGDGSFVNRDSTRYYSGAYTLRLVGRAKNETEHHYVERVITSNASGQPITVSFYARTRAFSGVDTAGFYTKVGSRLDAWQLSHRLTLSDNYLYYVTPLTPSIGDYVAIRFEVDANKTSDWLLVDELYLK